jgi:hypothetical protein
MKQLALVLIGLATVAPTAARSADIQKAFIACVAAGAREGSLEMEMPNGKPAFDPTTIGLNCEGDVAAALFGALELVSSQHAQAEIVSRSSGGVLCSRWTNDGSHHCTVEVSVSGPFADAIRYPAGLK